MSVELIRTTSAASGEPPALKRCGDGHSDDRVETPEHRPVPSRANRSTPRTSSDLVEPSCRRIREAASNRPVPASASGIDGIYLAIATILVVYPATESETHTTVADLRRRADRLGLSDPASGNYVTRHTVRTTRMEHRMALVFDSCAVVPRHLTVEQAHNILHIHSSCPRDQCPRRKAALFFLMDSRRTPRQNGRDAGRSASRNSTGLS
ncbi:hypothetical protein [Nocardia pseudobrasiliensis]|nr:hypothetical protein [Nocardia pseudobrasiliensis]